MVGGRRFTRRISRRTPCRVDHPGDWHAKPASESPRPAKRAPTPSTSRSWKPRENIGAT